MRVQQQHQQQNPAAARSTNEWHTIKFKVCLVVTTNRNVYLVSGLVSYCFAFRLLVLRFFVFYCVPF